MSSRQQNDEISTKYMRKVHCYYILINLFTAEYVRSSLLYSEQQIITTPICLPAQEQNDILLWECI